MSEEKNEYQESICAKSGFVLGIVSIITAFAPLINYLAIVMGILAIIFGLMGQKERKKIACMGIILGILSIIFTYIIINFQIDFAFNKISEVNNKLNMMNEENINDTENVLANELDVVIGTYEESNVVYDYDMISTSTQLPITLRNKSNETKSFNVMIEAIDENGDRITEDTVYVEKLRSGQSYQTNAFYYMSDEITESLNNATFRVLEASSY